MLHFDNIHDMKLWNALKEQRTQILIESTSSGWNNLFTEWTAKVYDRFNPANDVYGVASGMKLCDVYSKNVNNIRIEDVIISIGNQFHINTSLEQFENVTRDNLETAAEMVLYMTPCSTPLKNWFMFYADIFKNKHSAEILLALNRITKGKKTKENKELKKVASKVLKKVIYNFSSLHKNQEGKLNKINGCFIQMIV